MEGTEAAENRPDACRGGEPGIWEHAGMGQWVVVAGVTVLLAALLLAAAVVVRTRRRRLEAAETVGDEDALRQEVLDRMQRLQVQWNGSEDDDEPLPTAQPAPQPAEPAEPAQPTAQPAQQPPAPDQVWDGPSHGTTGSRRVRSAALTRGLLVLLVLG